MSKQPINFGIMLNGAGSHMNAWRHPSVPADASVNLGYNIALAQQAEAAGIAFVFVADGLYINEKSIPHFLNRFEPLTLLSALAGKTSKIGLGGTVSTSYSDPFTIARQFASLDLISGGRAGWNIVTSPLEGTARNFGRAHPEHSQRYAIASEYLEVVRGLWSSWEEDAFVRNRDSGQFFERTKLHRLNHKGQFFSVEGPLNIQRSPQGETVIFQAGASDTGIAFAAKYAEAIFTHGESLEHNQHYYRRVKNAAIGHGRLPHEVKIFPALAPIIGRTSQEAEDKYRAICELADIEDALAYLGRYFEHHDFSQYKLDAPFPDLGSLGQNSFRSTTDLIKKEAAERKLTLREVALEAVSRRSEFIGTPDEVSARIVDWVEKGAADGFILGFHVSSEGFDDFAREILPRLQAKGHYQGRLQASTLRENLGLPIPRNRYLAQQESLAA